MDFAHSLLPAALFVLAVLGHAFLWIGLTNRFDAVGAPRRVVKMMTGSCLLCLAGVPVAWLAWLIGQREHLLAAWHTISESHAVRAYLAICCIVATVTLLRLAYLRLRRSPPIVRFHRRRRLPMERGLSRPTFGRCPSRRSGSYPSTVPDRRENGTVPLAANSDHHRLARLPGNETLHLELSEWILDVPGLETALDGLSIIHLSDLHFTGWIGKAYFHEVVDHCNQLQPDLVAITGDLVDTVACLDWTGEVLGRLAARYGIYFVLGNHDRRIDIQRLRGSLTERGLIDLGGRCMQVEVRGQPVMLAGNERPWIGAAPGLDGKLDRDSPMFADHSFAAVPGELGHSPAGASIRPLRIALAHTPDQLRWARKQSVDLLLAGHTHGGQIRLPPLGAIFSPCLSGVKHVSGLFYDPPTILHVARGVSGSVPFRWNCRPEVALLRLREGDRP